MKTVIVVAKTETDGYGNLLVTDKEGKQVRVNKKHESLHPLFEQGKAVELDWQIYQGKDYVANARLVEEVLAGEMVVEQLSPVPQVTPRAQPAPQEIGMWWKELGNRIGDGSLEKDFPKSSVKIKAQYYNKMSDVTGVALKKEE